MPTVDLTPKMAVKSAENELYMGFVSGERSLGGNMGGIQFFSNGFKRGYGNNVFGSTDEGIWLGAADFEDAPFQVWMNGHMKAVDIDLTGSGYTKLNIFKQDEIPVSVAIGDLWFDTNDGNKMYRAASIGADAIATGEWEMVVATSITVFAQDSIPTSVAIGDLWYDTNDNNKPYRAANVGATTIGPTAWVLLNDLRAADALVKAGSSQVLTGDVQVGNGNVKIDGANKRILINDGTNDRILIGLYPA